MDNDTIHVVFCPQCGDSWITNDDSVAHKNCLCFKCGHEYIPDKVWTMWDFVYNVLKRTKC